MEYREHPNPTTHKCIWEPLEHTQKFVRILNWNTQLQDIESLILRLADDEGVQLIYWIIGKITVQLLTVNGFLIL